MLRYYCIVLFDMERLCVPDAISAFTRVFDALWQHEVVHR